MIELRQIKLPVSHKEGDLHKAVSKMLRGERYQDMVVLKRSLDARKKDALKYSYTVCVSVKNENQFLKKNRNENICLHKENTYTFPKSGTDPLRQRPVIVGAGPAGLFCGLFLAKAGYQPVIIERGADVDTRVEEIERFWETGVLNTESNVQFGEGGAGTFSDGKLNTLVNDKYGRNRIVLETFVQYGAPEEILYLNKPHIGTDLLRGVIKNMRNAIIAYGGTFHFQTKLTDIQYDEKGVCSITVEGDTEKQMPCNVLILALGHSARDTFSMLFSHKLLMEPKAFAVGVRIEHPREMIQISQYGESKEAFSLPTADYKLAHKAENGRNVYSFCMCPGGYVVNASSEENKLAVNGMSNHKRDAVNSNSAIIVNVTPEDFGSSHPLAGVAFQRKWEQAAFLAGEGNIPVQLFKDFKANKPSVCLGDVKPCTKGKFSLANLNDCLPDYVIGAIINGVLAFEKNITGFSREDAILSGIESRTSSPLRILRDEAFESNIKGIYPCGEGAGYAGGITSAAMDGIKVAEAIALKYAV